MNKRSAMVIAAGLVMSMLAGLAVFTLTMGGGTTATAQSVARPKPIVKTVKHTVTIHKKAKDAPAAPVVRVISSGSSGAAGVSVGSYAEGGDDMHESEHGDDSFEAEGGGGSFESGDD